MTSQSSITNKKRAGFSALFTLSARRYWTTVLLFGIVLFFILPVPVMMTISDRAPLDADDIYGLREMFPASWIAVIRYFVIIALSVFGVVTSCSRFAYLKNKVSIDFYHSLPVKRGQLFLTQLAVSAVAVAIPYLINILITVIIFATNSLMTEALAIELLIMSAEAIVYSIMFFSLSTLIGMISGLSAVQLTLTCVAAFIIPAIYLATLGFIAIFNESMWFEFYVGTTFFERTSPALRLILNNNPLSFFEAGVFLFIAAVMLVIAYAVYMRRKSERAGTPIVFPVLGEVIKYVLVYLGMLGFGLFFYFAMESTFWCIFGMICGTLLVFMLTNTILEKTARSMFKGTKGLAVFASVAAVCFILIVSNAFGINTRVPSPSFTSRVVADINDEGGTMEFRDKEVIKALHTLYTESERSYTYGSNYFVSSSVSVPYTYNHYDYYPEDSVRLEIVFYPKFGIPVAKSVTIYNRSEFVNEFRTLLDSAEFKEQYTSVLDNLEGSGYINTNTPHYKVSKNNGIIYDYSVNNRHWYFEEYSPDAYQAKQLGIDIMSKEHRQVNFDFFQQQSFGYMYARSDYRDGSLISGFYSGYARYTLFNSMTGLVDHYVDKGILNQTPDELIEGLAEAIGKLVITKYENGEAKDLIVTDKAQIIEALKCSASPTNNYVSPFTLLDTSYRAFYEISVTDANNVQYYYDEDGNETVVVEDKEESEIYNYNTSHHFLFLLGRVPDFVIEYFAE